MGCQCENCKEQEVWDCQWFCQNHKCKSLNSNWSNEPLELWICPFCGWNDWDDKTV